MINGVAKPIDNGNFLFLYCFANSVNNTIVINAMISGIRFNSGVAMLAVTNKTVYMPNGIVTIYLKLLALLLKLLVIASAPQIRHGIIAGNV